MRVDSIFISPSGEWKLGGFELLSNPKDDAAVLYVRDSCQCMTIISLTFDLTRTWGVYFPNLPPMHLPRLRRLVGQF